MRWDRESWRARARLSIGMICLASLGATAPMSSGADKPMAKPGSKTIGFALTGWRYGFVETPELTECEGGKVDPGPVAQLKATPGAVERIMTEGGSFEQTGPNGESPQHSPLVFNEALTPLHVPELVQNTGFGVNLDGTPDGRATAKTCKHEKFSGLGLAEGDKIDNQLARVLGCTQGYRTGGQTAEFYNTEIVGSQINRHLIEVTGVDNEVNDPSVEVYLYKGYDRLVRTGDGNWVPNLSQRIDTRYPQYNMKTTGKIVNGVLITDPIKNSLMPHSSQQKIGDRDMHDMVLRLKLTPDGADGILAGYDNWRHLWNQHAKRVTAELNKMTSPVIYRRFIKYADGYPDATGLCTHISSAYKVTAVRSLIVHPTPSERIAQK